jgi:hypothetical protein
LFRLFVHPNHFHNTFSAKISPKPIITPLTNGKKRLMVSDPRRATTRVLVEREESKDRGGCWEAWWLFVPLMVVSAVASFSVTRVARVLQGGI